MVQPLWKTVWRFFKKMRMGLPYDLAIPVLGEYPKELRVGSQRGVCRLTFTAHMNVPVHS